MKEEKKSRSGFVGLNNYGLLAIDYILAIKQCAYLSLSSRLFLNDKKVRRDFLTVYFSHHFKATTLSHFLCNCSRFFLVCA